ncbi:MAG TPA: hypothetical protein VKV06_12875 [Acidimicrobiales bacterium]|nr:hypothetical protein [Acidimicrobiales bacterium]
MSNRRLPRRPGGARPAGKVALAAPAAALVAVGLLTAPASAHGLPRWAGHGTQLVPGNLLVSTSSYQNDPAIVAGQTQLPPGCTSGNCVTANAGGDYPYVFNNDLVDGSFGVTSKIVLQQLSPSGRPDGTITVPDGGGSRDGDQLVTSFSSKSELALNQSTSGRYVTFMGYVAPVDSVDVSNANTPGVIDPTNPVPGTDYRAVAQLGANGKFTFTETNAYSGNNGRTAILNDSDGADVYYTAGNAGNGSNPQPAGVVAGAGTQLIHPSHQPEAVQNPGAPTPAGSFSVTELGDKADKIGKDDNFRGLTIFDHVVYYTKGSGSNGVNTVYFLDTTGKACPDGVGVPQPGAKLPTSPLAYDPATLAADGLPSNMCILQGFPTELAKASTAAPFGLWFANRDTLYVADEGDGSNSYDAATNTYTDAAGQTSAGLQKWVYDPSDQTWHLAYTLQNGLNLGQPYAVPGYPTGDNPATGLPWAPATDGLRNITGRVNANGTVSIYGVTSTVSGGGDEGADPNQLVAVTDQLGATSAPSYERFRTVRPAIDDTVVRGVSFTPGTPTGDLSRR